MNRLALALGLAVAIAAPPAVATKFRRPHDAAISLGYGYDHNGTAAGCKDYGCGSKCYNGHKGSDYPLPYGTTVKAAAAGTVEVVSQGCADVGSLSSTCGGGFGNYVRIAHADGKRSYYAHMKNGSMQVSVGQKVSCGQILGKSASSGRSSGYHLHFEARVNGVSRDPYQGSCGPSTSFWVSQGSYGSPPSTSCETTCACTPGQTQIESCGNCGTRTRTCTSSCQWGSFGTCSGQGVCAAGSKQSDSCGNCGTRTRTCTSSCQWGSFGTCSGQGVCAPGAKESGSCGNCGTRTRTCTSSCAWGSFGTCSGQGACAPGAEDSESCGDCGTRTRTCSASCGWGSFGACAGPDPEDGNEACDTGKLGACAAGRVRCEEGTRICRATSEAVPETCSGVDDDCNGKVDDGAPATLGEPPPEWAAELVGVSHDQSLKAGAQGEVTIEFRNVGTRSWQTGEPMLVSLDARAGQPTPLYLAAGWKSPEIAATPLGATPAGEVARFEFSVRAPSDAGAVSAEFQLASPEGTLLACPTPSAVIALQVLGGASAPDAGSDAGTTPAKADGPEPIEAGCACRTGGPPAGSSGGLALLSLAALLLGRRLGPELVSRSRRALTRA
jgi:MYXO-CTERM domain-containing protein